MEPYTPYKKQVRPMTMTEFERKAAIREAVERELAKKNYIHGIQGVDGGSTCSEQFKEKYDERH